MLWFCVDWCEVFRGIYCMSELNPMRPNSNCNVLAHMCVDQSPRCLYASNWASKPHLPHIRTAVNGCANETDLEWRKRKKTVVSFCAKLTFAVKQTQTFEFDSVLSNNQLIVHNFILENRIDVNFECGKKAFSSIQIHVEMNPP